MTITDYLLDHWGLLVILIGLTISLKADIHLEKRMVYRIALTNSLLFLYSVTFHIESYFGNQIEYSLWRPILCAVNYSIITLILANLVMILAPQQKAYFFIPALVNSVMCFISIPTKIVFYISDDNHFGRGPFGYLPYIVSTLYLVYLIYSIFKQSRIVKEDSFSLAFMSVTAVLCLVMPFVMEDAAAHWFIITIGIDVMLYYIFLLQRFTKCDPMTKLLNRQSYYMDLEKYDENITAIVVMDMNGLKEINDNEGHVAGDTALKSLSDCFWKAAQSNERVYRIGGDEFVMLCIDSDDSKVKLLVERIKNEISKTPYSCAVGYAIRTNNSPMKEMFNKADEMMYKEKKNYYVTSGKESRKRRLN